MDVSVQPVIQFLAAHPLWVALAMSAVAFAESLMIVSFIFPGRYASGEGRGDRR